jgi:hypothetical protein
VWQRHSQIVPVHSKLSAPTPQGQHQGRAPVSIAATVMPHKTWVSLITRRYCLLITPDCSLPCLVQLGGSHGPSARWDDLHNVGCPAWRLQYDHSRRGEKKIISEGVVDGHDDRVTLTFTILHGHAYRCSEISLKVGQKQQAGTSY